MRLEADGIDRTVVPAGLAIGPVKGQTAVRNAHHMAKGRRCRAVENGLRADIAALAAQGAFTARKIDRRFAIGKRYYARRTRQHACPA